MVEWQTRTLEVRMPKGVRVRVSLPANPLDPSQISDLERKLKIAHEELARLERIKPLSSAAAAVVHDVRNSLGVIQSTAQFVLSKLKPSEREKEAWELVERNVESIRKLLKGYLGLARQTESSKEEASLNEIVERVSHFVEPQCKKNNVKISMDLAPSLPKIMMDAPAVESAILNLSINGIEAMTGGGTLSFASKAQPEIKLVTLTIEDSGAGIPQDIRDKIFTPFYTTKAKGSGIGLYSARAIMQQNNGNLTYESKPGNTKMILTFTHG